MIPAIIITFFVGVWTIIGAMAASLRSRRVGGKTYKSRRKRLQTEGL